MYVRMWSPILLASNLCKINNQRWVRKTCFLWFMTLYLWYFAQKTLSTEVQVSYTAVETRSEWVKCGRSKKNSKSSTGGAYYDNICFLNKLHVVVCVQVRVRGGTESLETLEKKIFRSRSGEKAARPRSDDTYWSVMDSCVRIRDQAAGERLKVKVKLK